MSKHIQRQQGFTLLEIMIALTIFAVISTLAWQILDGAMRTSNATDVAAKQLNQLQRAYNLLERDFFQLQARAPRNEPDVFVQHDDALELTTLNGVSGQIQLERVRWRLEDKKTVARYLAGYRQPCRCEAGRGADPQRCKRDDVALLESELADQMDRHDASAGRRRASADHGEWRDLALGIYHAG
ncbi:general secretion pathway protein J [Enterobacter cloacae subsp. dissolvens SDM]|nr:general secretion pathway protein J [Enterobacter cloacae subsp. dissolvens SDM]